MRSMLLRTPVSVFFINLHDESSEDQKHLKENTKMSQFN